MIIRGTPTDVDNYILVGAEQSIELHENGFFPKYINDEGIYYFRTEELLEFVERGK